MYVRVACPNTPGTPPQMAETPARLDLLEDLESRQDELLRQLDELDRRIEQTLRQFQIQNRVATATKQAA